MHGFAFVMASSAGAAAVLALVAAAPAATQTRIPLQGGFYPDPWTLEIAATGTEEAGSLVRGCPGWVPAGPPLTISVSDPPQPLRIHARGEGMAGLLVEGPDRIMRCASAGADPDGIATLRVDPPLDGDHAIFPSSAIAGSAVTATILLSGRDLTRDEILRPLGVGATELALDAPPASGSHPLPANGGVTVDLTLSGVTGADLAGPDCYGQIDASRPDAIVLLEAPEPSLSIRLRSATDTTLVVVAPDGTTYCNDDTYGVDPEVSVTDAAAGPWAVWGGLYSGTGGMATLEARRAPGGSETAPAATLAHDAPPAAGLHELPAEAGLSVPLALSARDDAADIDWSCAGQIDASRPDAVVRLAAEEPQLRLRASSTEDTTLVVRAPDGTIHCNDDSDGLDPAVSLAPAPAGDYAVWVGLLFGGSGSATLSADRTAGGGMEKALGFGGLEENPFEGRTPATAAEALAILMEDAAFAAALDYDRLEELGPEGFALHGVRMSDPTGASPPLSAGRLAVTDLDLEGLAATGEPTRFALSLEDVDYAALVSAGEAFAMPLPPLAGQPPLTLSMSLLPPPDDSASRELAISAELAGQFALGLGAELAWAPGAPQRLEAAEVRAMNLEVENRGYVGAILRAQAREMGIEPEELVAFALDGLAEGLSPLTPGSPQEALVAALGEALADPDQPGVLRLDLATDEPGGLQPLFEAIEADPAAAERLDFDLSFQPLH